MSRRQDEEPECHTCCQFSTHSTVDKTRESNQIHITRRCQRKSFSVYTIVSPCQPLCVSLPRKQSREVNKEECHTKGGPDTVKGRLILHLGRICFVWVYIMGVYRKTNIQRSLPTWLSGRVTWMFVIGREATLKCGIPDTFFTQLILWPYSDVYDRIFNLLNKVALKMIKAKTSFHFKF